MSKTTEIELKRNKIVVSHKSIIKNQIVHLEFIPINKYQLICNKITIENLNYKKFFEKYTESISEDDLVYIDPPYYDTFVAYDGYGFSEDDQVTLCDTCSKLNCTVIASNSNTEFTRNLYTKNNFNIKEINAYRFINRNGQDRNKKPVEIICVKKTSET